MKLNLALAQINTKLGDVEANLEKHLDYIKRAKSEKADLLIFPELSLTGYVLQDLVASVAHKPTEDDPVFKQLLKASHDLDLVIGFVEKDSGHAFYFAPAYPAGGLGLNVNTKSIFLPMAFLMKAVSLHGEILCAPSTHALVAPACSSAKTSGTPRPLTCFGWMARTLCYSLPPHLVAG